MSSSSDVIPASQATVSYCTDLARNVGSGWLATMGTAAGWAWDGLKVTGSVINDIGANTTRNTVCSTATVAGGVLGGWSGSAVGAAIGSVILPGIGTAVGSVVGGVSAGLAASKATTIVTDRVLDDCDYDIETISCEKSANAFDNILLVICHQDPGT
ncbi:hypothetical protein L5515_005314 [Caenorhabditis briggsae]|uniref:Uncharacterized protein n=1 Tax=Caenorhabditis briggsae TaxID=6238 RepID=A0AAE9EPD9_CAEBR|nr:hypothetical protein L5515_005314 [Caenorhabditis briggsae]